MWEDRNVVGIVDTAREAAATTSAHAQIRLQAVELQAVEDPEPVPGAEVDPWADFAEPALAPVADGTQGRLYLEIRLPEGTPVSASVEVSQAGQRALLKCIAAPSGLVGVDLHVGEYDVKAIGVASGCWGRQRVRVEAGSGPVHIIDLAEPPPWYETGYWSHEDLVALDGAFTTKGSPSDDEAQVRSRDAVTPRTTVVTDELDRRPASSRTDGRKAPARRGDEFVPTHEQVLLFNVRLSRFYLPRQLGGRLETIRAVVDEAIVKSGAAGVDTGIAPRRLADGDVAYARRQWKKAFDAYRAAFLALCRKTPDELVRPPTHC